MLIFVITYILVVGCATKMTPEQHQIFANDNAMLNICSAARLLDANLVSQAKGLYGDRLRIYKADMPTIQSYYSQYVQQLNGRVTHNDCHNYAVQVHGELLQRQRALQDMQQLTQGITNLANAYASSAQQTAQAYQNATNSINRMSAPTIQPIQPIYNVNPPKTTCMQVVNGMVSCQTR